jgi:hypothetical protein
MRASPLPILLPAAVLACAPFALALDEMSASAEGRGAIAIQGQSLAVTRAEVSLIPGGRFIISLTGDQRYAFRGEWREEGNRIVLRVTEAQGSPAEGAGELRLRNGRFRTIQISGANRGFDASFDATGQYKDFTAGGTASDVIKAPVAPQITAPRPSRPEISAPVAPQPPAEPAAGVKAPKITVKGAGTLIQGRRDRKNVDAMEVFLEPGGALHLKTFGPAGETVLTGTWRAGAKTGVLQRFDLTIVGGFGAQASGRGFVLVNDDGRIERVSVQGTSRSQRGSYSLDFRQQ